MSKNNPSVISCLQRFRNVEFNVINANEMKMILLSCVSFVRSRVSASLVEQSDFLKLRN